MSDSQRNVASRRFSVWQKVVALAPLLLLGVYLPGQVMLRCRIDGLLRPACCCSHDSEEQGSGPVVKAQDCCAQEMLTSERPVVEAARSYSLDFALATADGVPVSAASLLLATPDWTARGWQAQAPPRDGPAIVLLKRAFLI